MGLFAPGSNLDYLRVGPQWTTDLDGRPGICQSVIRGYRITPENGTADCIAASQTLASAGYVNFNGTLNAGGASLVTYENDSTLYQNVIELDFPRTIRITGVVATAADAYVYGWDYRGMPMQETLTAGVSPRVGNKAFKWIRAIYFSAGSGTAITVGTNNTFGLPFYIDTIARLISPTPNTDTRIGNGMVSDAGIETTIEIGDFISPSTATSGDVRGTIGWDNADSSDYLHIFMDVWALNPNEYPDGVDQVFRSNDPNRPQFTTIDASALYGIPQYYLGDH